MARSRKTEQRYLSEPELLLLDKTHFPALRILDPSELLKLRKQLREIRSNTGAASGSAPAPTPIDIDDNRARHGLLAAAVKRVNREIERRRHEGEADAPSAQLA